MERKTAITFSVIYLLATLVGYASMHDRESAAPETVDVHAEQD